MTEGGLTEKDTGDRNMWRNLVQGEEKSLRSGQILRRMNEQMNRWQNNLWNDIQGDAQVTWHSMLHPIMHLLYGNTWDWYKHVYCNDPAVTDLTSVYLLFRGRVWGGGGV